MREIPVYISLPMHHRGTNTIDKIKTEMMAEFFALGVRAGLFEDADVLVDVNADYVEPAPSEECGRIWYLGRSIQKMEEAKYIIFHKNWQEAKGCTVEHAVATRYFNNTIGSTTIPPDVWTDGPLYVGKITHSIDEIFFNRCYK